VQARGVRESGRDTHVGPSSRCILRGGHDKVHEAGAIIAGGHTIDDAEPKYGLAVTGVVNAIVERLIMPGIAVIFGQPSGELEVRADRPVMRALSIQMGGRFIMGQGAVPILRDGKVIGACGVGGGTSEEDEQCARAGIEAI